MKRPSTPAAAVFLGIVAVFVLVGLVVVSSNDGPSGVTVGTTSVPRKDVDRELQVLAENAALRKAVGAANVSIAPGTLRSTPAAGMITSIVQEQLILQHLARVGERVTATDLDAGRSLRSQSALDAAFPTLPAWYQRQYSRRLGAYAALSRVSGATASDGSAAERAIRSQARRSPVSVSALYGRYLPSKLQVVPFTPPKP